MASFFGRLFGAVLILCGIFSIFYIGLYCGVWVNYVGSVCDIIDQVRAPVTNKVAVAYDILCFCCLGTLCLSAGIAAGIMLISLGCCFLLTGTSNSVRERKEKEALEARMRDMATWVKSHSDE